MNEEAIALRHNKNFYKRLLIIPSKKSILSLQ